ncbi:putative MFS aflatoxin efflux pump [Camillea tinctor]|nr:putative MFS aflatoxin efflux pump [Camillea tinctor]
MLSTCSFQLLFGKIYKFYPVRFIFLTTVVLLEAGSAICCAAPSSVVFIIGRATQGVGAAGIFSGVVIVIVSAVPLRRRPLYQGLFGAVFGISSVIGPLVGGAFTSSSATWRWCFYLNIPIGGVSLVVIGLLLDIPNGELNKLPSRTKLPQLDVVGTIILIPVVVCLLLALQWRNGRIIALLTLSIALLFMFILIQAFMPTTATIPPRIIKQQSIVAGCWQTVCVGSQTVIFVYYLPIWFQAVKGISAVDSGLFLLPLTLSMIIASISNGIFVSKIGYYTPTSILGTCIISIGAGLLTTPELNTVRGKWIGYQTSNLAAQTVLPRRDVPIGSSLMFFTQLLGGSIFTSVGENFLNNQLLQRLSDLPGFDVSLVEDTGAITLSSSLSPEFLHPVLIAYIDSLRQAFRVGLVLACLAVIGSVSFEWKSVKKQASFSKSNNDAEKGCLGTKAKLRQACSRRRAPKSIPIKTERS